MLANYCYKYQTKKPKPFLNSTVEQAININLISTNVIYHPRTHRDTESI
ncbi:hypothetical protein D039_3245A, partial [Vibrio parahaemolyticus EKP-028]